MSRVRASKLPFFGFGLLPPGGRLFGHDAYEINALILRPGVVDILFDFRAGTMLPVVMRPTPIPQVTR